VEFDVVTIVSAARGMPALRQVLSQHPSSFGAPIVCLVQASARTVEDLRAVTRLKVQWADAGIPLEKGTVYVSRPNCGLVCRPDRTLSSTPVSIDSTAHSPVDQFLSSTARTFGAGAACLVLAGLEGDGVSGAQQLKGAGGTVLVLDRATSLYWGLAEPIVRASACDRVLTLSEAADALRACFTGRDLLRCAEIQIELRALLDTALSICGTRMGHIARRTRDARHLQVFVHRGLGAAFLEHFNRIPVGPDTAAGRAALYGTRVVVPDVMAEADYRRREEALLVGYRAVHATPLPPSGRPSVRGVLTALFVQPHEVSRYEARDMDAVAYEAARIVGSVE
jgi:uncharacterized protein (DUF433 family)